MSKNNETRQKESGQPDNKTSGKLRIGDHWNAISIIALSQSNPLKAVAEFVENSIDAHAQNVTIIRGKEKGQPYLRIMDDGNGVPTDEQGVPDFKYVATHICDSIKREMKAHGEQGLQGEFGIGLLSFWTVGEELSMVSTGKDGKSYEMRMSKGDPSYHFAPRRTLIADRGTQLTIKPLLPGIRHFSGEKLQWYLASELRDRIRDSGVEIRIIDRQARAEYLVEPQAFSGRQLHHLPTPTTRHGDIYVELYLGEPSSEHHVGLYRSGTRVIERLTDLEEMAKPPWSSGYLQGVVDAPFLSLTPGTRLGVIQDELYVEFLDALAPLEATLNEIIAEQKEAEQDEVNRDTLRSIQRAFKEAMLALPEEEYDWFEVYGMAHRGGKHPARPGTPLTDSMAQKSSHEDLQQKAFFEHPGPLNSVRVAPSTCVVPVQQQKTFRAVPRDRAGRLVEDDLRFQWEVAEGRATLENDRKEIVTLTTSEDPELVRLRVTVGQQRAEYTAEALITVTDSLLPEKPKSNDQRGLPDYTFQKAPGELWRSRYDTDNNLVIVNNGHRDFVYASRQKTLKLRYVCRLFAKELVFHNFPGYSPEQLLERMIELSLYTEENLR
ncbi:MAG TPA: ATP-binding protein [Pirellulaceae bacterium]|nr:ATP-binding protein [Pirellulaceae bacterium]